MTETIKQEIADIFYEDVLNRGTPYPKKGCARGIKKYHISRKGTARLNKEYKRLMSLPFKVVKIKDKFKVEVERFGGL